MNIPSIQTLPSFEQSLHPLDSSEAEKVPAQFEAILLRQFLSESMKPLLQDGPAGQVYGYMLTDALAGSVATAGGLGLCSVLQAQLAIDRTHVEP